MRTSSVIPVALVVLAFSLSGAAATTRLVPTGPYPTIQSAITASATGDTVLVQPGTYTGSDNKNLDYAGNDIVVQSLGGASVTTIDCQNSGLGVIFDNGETAAAVFDGFTITNGEGALSASAIEINGSSPTISNCRVTGTNSTAGLAGGVVFISGNASFVNCTFDYNSNTSSGIIYVFDGSPSFTDCDIENNTAGTGVWDISPGPSSYTGCSFSFNDATGFVGSHVTLDACTFDQNSGTGALVSGATTLTSCIISYNLNSGISVSSGTLVVDDCDIIANYSSSEAGGVGIGDVTSATFTNCNIRGNIGDDAGGVDVSLGGTAPTLSFTDCTISGNEGGMAGGVRLDGFVGAAMSPAFTGCTIAGNRSINYGGGINITPVMLIFDLNPILTGCTVADNEAAYDGGGIYFNITSSGGVFEMDLDQTIVWGNCASGTGDEAYVIGGTLSFVCSITNSAQVLGTGTINYDGLTSFLDPFYCGDVGCTKSAFGDYTVTDDSPALAANNPCGLDIGAHPQGCVGPFTDVTNGPLGDTGNGFTAAWGDYDNDSDLDLYVGNALTPADNKLLRNEGSYVFTDVTSPPIDSVRTNVVAWGDYDGDGDVDLYAATGGANRLYRNDGAGTFTDVTSGPLGDTGNCRNAAWLDYDLDGDLDIYIVNVGSNKLLRNDGGGTFTDQSSSPVDDAGSGYGLAVADYDNDGDPDIYIGNSGTSNKLFRNDGGGTFADVTSPPLDKTETIGAAWGDYNNDGHFDLYLANNGANYLLRNDGGGSFTDVTTGVLGDTGFGTRGAWVDYDNDGDVDFHLVNLASGNRLYRNDGGGTFSDVTLGWIGDSRNSTNSTWGDADNDGDLDVYVTSQLQENKLLRNNVNNGNHWLQVDLQGIVTNRNGIGTRIRVVAGGSSQIQEVPGFEQHSVTVEFGLGSSTTVDSLVVGWLSGTKTYLDVAVDQRLTLEESFLITGVNDIPNDQGRQVRVEWSNNDLDVAGSPTPIQQYAIYRKVDPNLMLVSNGEIRPRDVGDPSLIQSALGWDFLVTVPATAEEGYSAVVPTLRDSTINEGMYYTVFFVRALTATPSVYFDCPPDSGYSVDNLAPFVPSGFVVAYNTGGGNELNWDESGDEDLQYYRIYRSTDPAFTPSPATLVDGTTLTNWTDPTYGDPGVYYKVTAVDFSGNESDPASPVATAVGDVALPTEFRLSQNVPNPFNPTTAIYYDVAVPGGRVTLRIYDVSGRLVRTLVDRVETPGRKTVTWDGRSNSGRTVVTGVYFYRMIAPGFEKTRKMLMAK